MKEIGNQLIKFGIVGAVAFLIDYLILIFCKELLDVNVLISAAIAFTISVIFNYIASIKWVFNVSNNRNKKTNFIVFIVLSIIGLIITEVIMYIGISISIINTNYIIVKVVATFIVMCFNFITRKQFLEVKAFTK